MTSDWTCHVCGTEVSWGTVVCPLCGSALEWEEVDEDDPDAVFMPPRWDEDDDVPRRRWTHRYAIAAIAAGLIITAISVASGSVVWGLLIPGMLLVAAGVYGLAVLPRRYP